MGLPRIDLEQAEVFQTSDLPEADQHYSLQDEASDAVETIRISVNEAFGRFKGSYLDNESVDFSDRLRNSKRKGYISWKGVEDDTKEETPVHQYQRLNCEIRELLEDVKEAKVKKDSGLMPDTLESLFTQVEALQKYLAEMRLEEIVGKERIAVMTDPQAALRKKLLSELDELKGIKPGDVKEQSGSSKNVSSLRYELMVKPETGKLRESADLLNLYSRIQALEKALGASDEHLEIICTETGKRSLVDAIAVLSAKTTVLDPKNLDHIEGRVAILQQKLAKLQEVEAGQEPASDDPEVVEKIDRLHGCMQRTNGGLAQIPHIMDRLEALSPLHAQATEVCESMLELETVQQQILAKLRNNNKLLKEVQEKFDNNLQNIHKNCDSLSLRIEKLKK